MKGKMGVFAAMVVVAVFFAVESSGQMMGGRGGGWGMGGSYGRMYDPAAVETVSGEVVEVGQVVPVAGMSQGVHLVLSGADGEMIAVHLGPAWFIENQDIVIDAGDLIEVTGSRITFNGEPAIIAQQVTRGDDVLVLRDDRGFPVWSGWRKR